MLFILVLPAVISFKIISLIVEELEVKEVELNADAPRPWQLEFQDPASALQEGIIQLHDDIMFYLCFIFGFVFSFIVFIIIRWSDARYGFCIKPHSVQAVYPFHIIKVKAHHLLELIWTLIPSGILLTLVLPTFSLIYSLDDLFDAELTLKVIGHQWYWSYEFGDIFDKAGDQVKFDSYMLSEADLKKGQLRLLEVDNRVLLPVQTHIRILVTSADVIHSWAIPSLGVKMDACPGRLNQVALFITRVGTFYGQCSEICGVNHAFMPICIECKK